MNVWNNIFQLHNPRQDLKTCKNEYKKKKETFNTLYFMTATGYNICSQSVLWLTSCHNPAVCFVPTCIWHQSDTHEDATWNSTLFLSGDPCDLTVSLLLLLYHMSTVVFPSDHSDFDAWQVLSPPTLNQDHVVLLQVVTLTWNKGHRFLSVRQTHPRTLPVCRVGLLGLSDHGLQNHCFQLGAAKGGSNRFRWWFGLSLAVHLVKSGHSPGEDRRCPGRGLLGRCRRDEKNSRFRKKLFWDYV